MNNIKSIPQNLQVPKIEDGFIFNFPNSPVFMFEDGQFWIRIDTVWTWLGTLERAYLRGCELHLLVNDPAAGTYAKLNDFLSICPQDMQVTLNEQKTKMLAMMKAEG